MIASGRSRWFSRRTGRTAPAPFLLALVLLAGCSGPASSSAGDSSTDAHAIGVGLPRATGGSASVTLEQLTPNQQLFLSQAEEELTRRCMAKQGFDFALPKQTVQDFGPDFLTADQLEAGGYRLGRKLVDAGRNAGPNDAILATLSPDRKKAWNLALFGDVIDGDKAPSTKGEISVRGVDGSVVSTSAKGCVSDARKQIYGSLEGYLSLSLIKDAVYGNAVENQLWADPAYQAVAVKWRACMARHDVPVDEHAVYGATLVQVAYDQKRPDAAQYAQTVQHADVSCMRETKIDAIRAQTLDRLGRAQIQRSGLNVAGASVFQQQALVRARALLAGSAAS